MAAAHRRHIVLKAAREHAFQILIKVSNEQTKVKNGIFRKNNQNTLVAELNNTVAIKSP